MKADKDKQQLPESYSYKLFYGKQYIVYKKGETYSTSGYHFCTNPLSCYIIYFDWPSYRLYNKLEKKKLINFLNEQLEPLTLCLIDTKNSDVLVFYSTKQYSAFDVSCTNKYLLIEKVSGVVDGITYKNGKIWETSVPISTDFIQFRIKVSSEESDEHTTFKISIKNGKVTEV